MVSQQWLTLSLKQFNLATRHKVHPQFYRVSIINLEMYPGCFVQFVYHNTLFHV